VPPLFYLDNLLLKGFRNYSDQQLLFHPNLNLIVGENAQGKTNLLESIYYLSVTRSFRTIREQELANFEDRTFFIRGQFVVDDFKHKVQVSYRTGDQLKVLVDDNPAYRFDHLQRFPVVVFSPDDLQIIKDGPSVRRRFLNLEGSRLSPLYFNDLKNYHRSLLQRNTLVKNINGYSSVSGRLEPWDQAVASFGVKIIQTRMVLIKALEKEADYFFESMTGSLEKLTLTYRGTVNFNADANLMKDSYLNSLRQKHSIDIKRGSTSIGPHLDDFLISINGFDTRHYSSQGQKRTAALALKMAEVSLFNNRNKECPIILLDDVFSEFDQSRKEHLLKFIKEKKGQCYISTAGDLVELADSLGKDCTIIKVKQGRVSYETDQLSS
jgi:DNA replication and repair protein RecF